MADDPGVQCLLVVRPPVTRDHAEEGEDRSVEASTVHWVAAVEVPETLGTDQGDVHPTLHGPVEGHEERVDQGQGGHLDDLKGAEGADNPQGPCWTCPLRVGGKAITKQATGPPQTVVPALSEGSGLHLQKERCGVDGHEQLVGDQEEAAKLELHCVVG